MDAELKTKWVAALRSGKYRQGTGKLRKDGVFCCLGVLADVAGCKWDRLPGSEIFYPIVDGIEGETDLLGPALSDKLGLSEELGDDLAGMNDGGNIFTEIADEIERKL